MPQLDVDPSCKHLPDQTPGPGMSRPLLKFSGGSVHDYATFSTAGFSQLTNHGTPNRSTSLPNRSAQKVSAMGICTVPPSASALKMRSASTASFGLSITQKLSGCLYCPGMASQPSNTPSPEASPACRIFLAQPGGA